MRYTQLRGLAAVAVAIASMVAASSAFAVAVNPFSPSLADVQGLGNSTQAENFSTIDAINIAPDGIHLDVTWRTGQNTDPFAPFFGQNFPRIGVTKFTNGDDGGLGRNLTSFDGIKWCIMSDQPVFSQPFLQTAPNWTFYEPSNGGNNIPGDMSMQMSTISFDEARNFSGLTPANIVHPDANGEIRVNAMGLQIVGPPIVVGEEIPGHIWITYWIPEPSSATLLVMGAMGLVGLARRRQG